VKSCALSEYVSHAWVVRGDEGGTGWVQLPRTVCRHPQIVPIAAIGAVAGRKPRAVVAVDRLRKASNNRDQQRAEVSPHAPCRWCIRQFSDDSDMKNSLGRASVGRPWCQRVRANSDCAHATLSRWLTCCATENFLLIITPSAFISSTLIGMVGTAGGGIYHGTLASRWHKNDLHWLDVIK